MRKVNLISFLVFVLCILNSCTKEPITPDAQDNFNKNISAIEEDIIFRNEIERWNYNILERIQYYRNGNILHVITDGYNFSVNACRDILGNQVITNQLLTVSQISSIKRFESQRYAPIISNSNFSDINKYQLNEFMNNLFDISRDSDNIYVDLVKEIKKFEDRILESLSADDHESKCMFIITSIARSSAYFFLKSRHSVDFNENYVFSAIAAAIYVTPNASIGTESSETSRQMLTNVKMVCAASMTPMVNSLYNEY